MTTKQRNYLALIDRLRDLGFTLDEAEALRRIEMTLHRWCELECGDGNDYASWAVERDETTGKPFRCIYPHTGTMRREAIADREKGALKRLDAIMAKHTDLVAHYQTDCRGCALYVIRKADIPSGQPIDAHYTRGLAIAA